MANVRARAWVWTLNNYTCVEREFFGVSMLAVCEYCCYQPEVAPTTGTPHLQGFVSFKNPRMFAGVKALFGPTGGVRVHLEQARGTPQASKTYCSKEESRDPNAGFGFIEIGVFNPGPGQGSRSDLAEIGRRIIAGEALVTVAQDYPGDFIRYSSGFQKLKTLFQPHRSAKTKVFWFYGTTGTGKSHAARARFPEAYWKSPEHLWWDGYDGVADVVVDDYRCDFCKFAYLLRLFDEYQLQVQVKGGTVNFAAGNIVITAPRRPEIMWSNRTEEDLQQLMRRIEIVELFGDEPAPPRAIVANFHPI